MANPTLGKFYKDENLSVFAFKSNHLPNENGSISSFSYLIEIADKKIVYSGDVKSLQDLAPAVENGCDLLICETGHHTVESVCNFAQDNKVIKLILTHHGREILENRPTVKDAISNCKLPVEIAFDEMNVELGD